jgi:hypothetical protein
VRRGGEHRTLCPPAPLTPAGAAPTLPAMSWKVSITGGAELDEPAIRELWSFRLSIMRLKPHVPPEEDFAKFASLCRQARRVLRLRDSQGRLGNSLVPLVYDASFQSERFRLVIPEYIYAVPELRGRAVATWAWARSMVPLLYAPGVRVFLGGIGYPTGVLALDRFMGPLWLYGEPQAPAQARQVLEWIVSNVAGESWDPVSQQVDMNTIPSQPTEAWRARSQRRELYRRYVERCPWWQEGRTVPCVCEYSTGKILKAVLWAARRWWTHSPA